ncbi:MAG: ankyrin repeat domain-containing protein [Puniceicoccales bacterium]|jgi:hypothetical protein|nr:ankyrin repeat domain-containing protein [Puniceicoccales bacterium]
MKITEKNITLVSASLADNFKQCNNSTENALDYATRISNPNLIGILLENPDFQFNTKYENGFIDIAIQFGGKDLLKKAIKRDLPEEQAPILLGYLQKSLMNCLEFIFQGYLEYCFSAKNCSDLIVILSNWICKGAHTINEKALIAAIIEGDENKVANSLAINSLNINDQDQRGNTPLIWAVVMGNLDIVFQILAMNLDRALRNDNGETALDIF